MSDARQRRRQKRQRNRKGGSSRRVVREVRRAAERRSASEAKKAWPEWLRYAAGGAAIVGGLSLFIPAGAWFDIQGGTKERAEIVSVRPHPGTDDCHTRVDATRPNRAVTWRSLNPPDDLDETFVQIEGCSVPEVGEVHTVYRIGGEPGNVLLRVDPIDSFGEALQVVGIGVGSGVVVGFFYLGVDCARDRFADWRTKHPVRSWIKP